MSLTELVGLTDHDLAARAHDTDRATLTLGTESNRRDLLARLFPDGRLLERLRLLLR